MKTKLPRINFRMLYDGFNSSTTPIDCGKLCAPNNPHQQPFCCDVCHAVPVAYKAECDYLATAADQWHLWRGDECPDEPCDPAELQEQTPDHLNLITCKGASACQREFRAISCRQFPFFPYITSDYRFIGLSPDWEFEPKCWIITHLDQVTPQYRAEFVKTFDLIFSYWMDDFDSYLALSDEVRKHYRSFRRRIPLLHRNGHDYLISAESERMYRTIFSAK